jgi:hypothetical protein
MRRALSLSMFIGVFISLLFFIGAGSMLYFKLFTELPDDRRLFHSLRRIGITGSETRRVVSAQMALIFFLPFLVGALHALFALWAPGNMLLAEVTLYSLIVIGLFALIQAAFYGLARWTYLRAQLPALKQVRTWRPVAATPLGMGWRCDHSACCCAWHVTDHRSLPRLHLPGHRPARLPGRHHRCRPRHRHPRPPSAAGRA